MELKGLDDEVLFGDNDEEVLPPSLRLTATPLDLAFHPSLPLLAAGLVNGEMELYHINGNEVNKKHLENDFGAWLFKSRQYASTAPKKNAEKLEHNFAVHHNHGNMQLHPVGGITGLEFTDDGSYLVSASSDGSVSVLDCVTMKMVIHLPSDQVLSHIQSKSKKKNPVASSSSKKGVDGKKKKKDYAITANPHQHGISALNICDENLISTGDDDGLVAIWDMRQRNPSFTYHEHGDYVSQLLYFSDANELVTSSGDTCIGVFDLRAGKIRDYSETRKDELTCFAFVNASASSSTFVPSIVCGTTSGSLPMWKYGSWRRPYDVLDGHPKECEAMISFHNPETAFNHNLLLTGAFDGIVRVLQLYPVRRTLCHLSARDGGRGGGGGSGGGSGFTRSAGSHFKRDHLVVRRERGSEAIRRIRVSEGGEGNLLAVCGEDQVVDFVDVRFLRDPKALQELRYKKEQRYMSTLQEMEEEQAEKEERERRMEEEEEEEEDSSDDSSTSSTSSDNEEEQVKLSGAHRHNKKDASGNNSISASDSDEDDEEEDSSSSSEEEDEEEDKPITAPNKRRRKEGGTTTILLTPSIKQKLLEDMQKMTDTENPTKHSTSTMKKEEKEKPKDEKVMDSMERYQTERAKKRERVAAAKWLKEEKKKKVNFGFEKRRKRTGGFFGDLQN